MASEFRVIPLDFDRDGNLLLAMADPADTHAVDEIAFFTGTFVVRAVAGPSAVAWALNHYHGIKTRLARPKTTAPIALPTAPPAERFDTLRDPAAEPTLPELVMPGERPPATPVQMEVREQGSGVLIVQKLPEPIEIRPRKKLPPAVIIDDVIMSEEEVLPPPSSPESEAAF